MAVVQQERTACGGAGLAPTKDSLPAPSKTIDVCTLCRSNFAAGWRPRGGAGAPSARRSGLFKATRCYYNDCFTAESASPRDGAAVVEQQHRARGGPGLVSAKEARDLQMLLDMFSLGYSDVEELQNRLHSELGALEVGSGPICCSRLNGAKPAGLLDPAAEAMCVTPDSAWRQMGALASAIPGAGCTKMRQCVNLPTCTAAGALLRSSILSQFVVPLAGPAAHPACLQAANDYAPVRW